MENEIKLEVTNFEELIPLFQEVTGEWRGPFLAHSVLNGFCHDRTGPVNTPKDEKSFHRETFFHALLKMFGSIKFQI